MLTKRFDTIWAIRPEAAHTVLELMSGDLLPRRAHRDSDVPTLAAQWGALPNQSRGGTKLAIVGIHGVLTNDGPSHYGSNYRAISDGVSKAAADPGVSRIILSVDSPGGEVTGCPECASAIAAAAKIKPVSAIVEGSAASAAYWLASQASDITLTPSGEVGSVGVRTMHVDMSKKLEAEGYRVTELHSGDFKTEMSPYKPLSKDAEANIQTKLEYTHRQFLNTVSKGRGTRASAAAKQGQFGGGRMLSAQDALAHGMVDRLQSARDFYKGASTGSAAASTAAASPVAPIGASSPYRTRLALERLRG